MKQIYLRRKGDAEVIAEYKQMFAAETLEELADDYNRQVKCGIVGVHQQALYLIAMRQEFRERFKDSPIHFQEYILSLYGPVEVVDGKMIIRELPS